MPISLKTEQERFQWTLQDGKPVALVFVTGNRVSRQRKEAARHRELIAVMRERKR